MKIIKNFWICVFVLMIFTSCKKEILHTNKIIIKHNLTHFYDWDSQSTPFKKNASLYVNKETDSCLLILKNKEKDTLLCHLDTSIINTMLLEYFVDHGNWIVIKKDYGKTTYDDSLGEINNQNKDRFPLAIYYKINKEKRKLEEIPVINKKEFSNKITKKYIFLKKIQIVGLDNNTTYFFKDTLNDKQVLYELATNYTLEYNNGNYVLQPTFKNIDKVAIYKNGITVEEDKAITSIGKKVFYGNNDWEFKFRYEISVKKYYRFKRSIKKYNNLPGNEIFKTEMLMYDWKNKTSKIIKNFPKDSLYENLNIGIEQHRNGKYYVGEEYLPNHFEEFYYELDTINWKLKTIK